MAKFYRYQKYQKYINGEPTDEYKEGELIGEFEYDNQQDCERGAIYQWVDNGKEVCDEYSLYKQQKKQRSLDGGNTWTDTGELRLGDLVEEYSEKCGWKRLYRWEPTGKTFCDGYVRKIEYIYQYSNDMGKTWINVDPPQYKYGVKDEYDENCILESEPFTFQVEGDRAALGASMHPYKVEYEDNTGEFGFETRFFNKNLYYKYWIQWDEEEPVIPVVQSYTTHPHETGSSYTWSLDPIGSLIIPAHQYTESKIHIIKIWGLIATINPTEGSVLKWGTASTLKLRDQIKYGWGGHTSIDRFVDYYSHQLKYVSFGPSLKSWIDDSTNALKYNEWFEITNNTIITKLPVETFQNMLTNHLDVSNCPNLLAIPPLKSPEGNKVHWSYLRATNCTSLTAAPEGIFQEYKYEDAFIPYIRFDCKEAFKGCINLTTIPSLIMVDYCNSMFEGCPITDISHLDLIAVDASYMFKDCTQLTNIPKSMTCYKYYKVNEDYEGQEAFIVRPDLNNDLMMAKRIGMFQNSGVTEVGDSIFNEDNNGYYQYDYTSAFEGCPNLTKVTGVITQYLNFEKVHTYNRMFYGCPITEVSPIFKNSKEVHRLKEMFSNCQLVTLPNDFYNAEANWIEYSTEYEDLLSNFDEVFTNNLQLTNYPIQNTYPIWHWSPFYQGALKWTYAFRNCPLIAEQVPMEWGGYSTTIKPVIIETEAQSIQVSLTSDKDVIMTEDNMLYRGSTRLTFDTEGPHIIKLFVQLKNKWSTSKDVNIKILDFGSSGLPDYQAYYGTNSNSSAVLYVGTDQGCFKASTIPPIKTLVNVEEVSPDYLKSGVNINTMENMFRYNKKLTSMPDGFFQRFTKLSNVSRIFQGSTLTTVNGMFEGCSSLLNVYDAFDEAEGITSAERVFKDCTKLSSLAYCFGTNPQYNPLPCNCNQAFENTAVVTFEPNGFMKLTSAIGMFRNCIKLQRHCTFELSTGSIDITEMFKNCSVLNYSETKIAIKIPNNTRVNFTRCWENCTSLQYPPKVTYGGTTMYPWEVPNAIGTGCFAGCTTLLEGYGDQIPDDWK